MLCNFFRQRNLIVAITLWQLIWPKLGEAQGTVFTYQGCLLDRGQPATGVYSLEFALTDAATGGDHLGPTLTNVSVLVNSGLFTVSLDFGGAVFDGSPRWLEIGVRTNGARTPFALLFPRQPLTATPYALLSGKAWSASTAETANNLASSATMSVGRVTSEKFIGNAAGLTNLTVLTNLTETYWTKPVVLIVAGDSITKGNNVTPNIMTWPYWLTNIYWKDAPFVASANLSLESMNYAQDWLAHYDDRIRPFAPGSENTQTNAYLMVWLGLNDIWRGDSAEGVLGSLSNIWRMARCDGFRVVAFTLTDSVNVKNEYQPERRRLNHLIRTAAGQWDYLVDTGVFLGDNSTRFGNTSDGVHFTTNRHALIAGLVDWTLRNGSRRSAPFPLSDYDACRGINAPNLSMPNQFDRMLTIKADPNSDDVRSIYGVGLNLTGPYSAITMAQTGSSYAWTASRGKFQLWSALGDANFMQPYLSYDPVSHDLNSAGAMTAANGFAAGDHSGITTNVAFLAPGPMTNYLRFVGGILVGITNSL
jgi:hypothetical protein